MRKKGKQKRGDTFLHEIISDAQFNQFNLSQVQGRFSIDISKKSFILMTALIFIILILLFLKVGHLQLILGEEYRNISNNNTFTENIIFAERGLIYDRFQTPLVENHPLNDEYSVREYPGVGFGQLLGYVNYPAKDKYGIYYQTEIEGLMGVERSFNHKLKGRNGSVFLERDASQNIITEHFAEKAIAGDSIVLSIDSRLQNKTFSLFEQNVSSRGFKGAAFSMMDIKTGELLALVSYPDFDPIIFTEGNINLINKYLESPSSIFLHRAISGLYTPGSTIKPFFAIAALEEEVIDPNKHILSKGFIEVANPFIEGEVSVFRDWKVHGYVNIIDALAVSSNEYFYHIGGGYEEQEGLGINKLNVYAEIFGFGRPTELSLYGEPSGVIPNKDWKERVFDDVWRLGDTYNTVIGQYGFQVTPLQLTRAMAAIANNGVLVEPHILLDKTGKDKNLLIEQQNIDIVQQGLRRAVLTGTAKALNVFYVDVAAKTGTAQIDSRGNINALITGFFPYNNPKYAFTLILEAGDGAFENTPSEIMRLLFDWMYINIPEYLEDEVVA